MANRTRGGVPADYGQNVFVNCPIDETYLPLFRALIFAVFGRWLRPRCAQEAYDGGDVRIEKIVRIIRACRWETHDISRTDLIAHGLPRFNMPLELGLFLGARAFGAGPRTKKSCLILDSEIFRYQKFIGDIAGQDIAVHGNDPAKGIKAVRDWLTVSNAGFGWRPSAAAISQRYNRFTEALPRICRYAGLDVDNLTYVEFADTVSTWLRRELSTPSA